MNGVSRFISHEIHRFRVLRIERSYFVPTKHSKRCTSTTVMYLNNSKKIDLDFLFKTIRFYYYVIINFQYLYLSLIVNSYFNHYYIHWFDSIVIISSFRHL